MKTRSSAAHHRHRTVRRVVLAIVAAVVVCVAGRSHAKPATAAATVASPSLKSRAASTLRATVERALALHNPRREGKTEPAQAKRFLTRLLPVTRRYAACRRGSRRHLLRSPRIRLTMAKSQFKRLKLHETTPARPANRHLIRGVYDDLAARAVGAFGFPPATLPGLAVLGRDAHQIPSTLANGGIVINEEWLGLAEMGAKLMTTYTDAASLRDGLLRSTLKTFGRAQEGSTSLRRRTPQVTVHVRAMVAYTIAHEMTHGVQLVACSIPVRRWKNAERRRRELEADVGGIVLAACAGHPLETLVAANLVMGIMDALARVQGVREKPYPPWEKRMAAMFGAVAYVRRLQAKGRWPKKCAPLRVDKARLLKRRATMAWLKQLSTRRGLNAALARKKP